METLSTKAKFVCAIILFFGTIAFLLLVCFIAYPHLDWIFKETSEGGATRLGIFALALLIGLIPFSCL